jgi:hypothetical protein
MKVAGRSEEQIIGKTSGSMGFVQEKLDNYNKDDGIKE